MVCSIQGTAFVLLTDNVVVDTVILVFVHQKSSTADSFVKFYLYDISMAASLKVWIETWADLSFVDTH